MSDTLPPFRTRLESFKSGFGRNAPVPEMTPDLAKRLGLEKLAELKRNWNVKRPSSQKVVSTVRNDLQTKNKKDSEEGRAMPLSKRDLQGRLAQALDGIQFGHREEVSQDVLNKIMW